MGGEADDAGTGFGPRLKSLREAAGLSQQALAVKAGMNVFGVAKLEQGAREPGWATVLKLAAALGVQVTAFSSWPPPSPDRLWRAINGVVSEFDGFDYARFLPPGSPDALQLAGRIDEVVATLRRAARKLRAVKASAGEAKEEPRPAPKRGRRRKPPLEFEKPV